MQQAWGRDPFTQRKCLSRDICACLYIERFGERMPGEEDLVMVRICE